MDENYQSEWTKSIPLKEQKKIIKRLMKFAKPFRRTFIVAILFAFALSVINVLLQGSSKLLWMIIWLNSRLRHKLFCFCWYVLIWSHSKSIIWFSMVFVFHGLIEDLSVY